MNDIDKKASGQNSETNTSNSTGDTDISPEPERQTTNVNVQEVPVGSRVVDRDADPGDRNPAVVVELPEEPAYAYHIGALGGSPSVADLNPDYGASGPVATVAFVDALDAALDVWREADPAALATVCENEEVRTYTYPVERLRALASGESQNGLEEFY